MRLIDDYHSTNPYFNLAAEEYFLTETKEDVCRFWQNENAVVIGKHQALPAEVNTKVAQENGIAIARRISGGGTVFHDLGNLNFTFIKNNGAQGNMIDFKQFTQPIVNALAKLDLEVMHSGRNDLLLNGFKISGNAEHLSQKLNRTLHHGTLLFNSNLDSLGAVLKTPIRQFEGKFVHSKRSEVCNISPSVKEKMDLQQFRTHLSNCFEQQGMVLNNLQPHEIAAIEKLASEKYEGYEWIMGYSPKFMFNANYQGTEVKIFCEKGRIVKIETGSANIKGLTNLLIGSYYAYPTIKEKLLKEVDLHSATEILAVLFEI